MTVRNEIRSVTIHMLWFFSKLQVIYASTAFKTSKNLFCLICNIEYKVSDWGKDRKIMLLYVPSGELTSTCISNRMGNQLATASSILVQKVRH